MSEMSQGFAYSANPVSVHRAADSLLDTLPLTHSERRLMRRLSEVTMVADGRRQPLGRRIIEAAAAIHRQVPDSDFGLVSCLLVASLVASVPSVGDDLGGFVPHMLMTFDLSLGTIQSAADGAVTAMVDDATWRLRDQFAPAPT